MNLERSAGRSAQSRASAVGFRLDPDSSVPMYEQFREQLLLAVDSGRRSPGARLPSVRQLARRHHVNPKTVHRIYRRLESEGLVELRPGSGAFVRPMDHRALENERLLGWYRFFRSSVFECGRLGVDPDRALQLFSSFVSRARMREARIRVAERSAESAGLLAREISGALGVRAEPWRWPDATSAGWTDDDGACTLVVTTDSERTAELAAGCRVPVLRLSIDPALGEGLRRIASQECVLLIVRDAGGIDELLGSPALGLGEARSRIRVAEARRAWSALSAGREERLIVSALVGESDAATLPGKGPRLVLDRLLAPGSLDLIEAAVLFGDRPAHLLPR